MGRDVLKILIIDDQLICRVSFIEKVENRDDADKFEVTSAVDGAEALSLVKENFYDIVVVDLSMPNMNGWEFLEEYKKHDSKKFKKSRKFIASAEGICMDNKQKMNDLDVLTWFTKPVQVGTLLGLLPDV